jgi:hypothetical protein
MREEKKRWGEEMETREKQLLDYTVDPFEGEKFFVSSRVIYLVTRRVTFVP